MFLLGEFIKEGALVNVFPEPQTDTDELGSCILVTSKHVVLIKQRYEMSLTFYTILTFFFSMRIEQLFQQMLMKKLHVDAEHLAKLVGANVQELYKVAIKCCTSTDAIVFIDCG